MAVEYFFESNFIVSFIENAILLYPLYADAYWKISNDPESRSV